MKITVKYGLIFAALWIALKLILFMTLSGEARYNLQPAILTNILCLLLSISFGLYFHKRQEREESNALSDIKNAMSAGVPYTIIVSVFLYFYYTSIDPEFNRHQLTEAQTELQKVLDDPEDFQALKDSNADFEVMSKEEIRENIESNQEAMFSAQSVTTISLLGMLILSTINSIFVTAVFRRVVFRKA